MTAAPRPAGLGRAPQQGLTVPCPHCKANAGRPCTIPANGRRLAAPHPSRLDAAEGAAA
ncbi:zinc finger domain-containing protein [Streptomyces sp. NPDC003509]